jgi:dihydrofolate reductase
MLLTLVVAMARNRVIGVDNRLPWRLPEDLRFFRQVTLGKPVIMGRWTYESIGRPLPGRINIVLTAQVDYPAAGCRVVHSLAEALTAAEPSAEAMVIGGAAVYAQALPRADRIYLTEIAAEVAGDVRFPELDPAQWRLEWREAHPADAQHAHAFNFTRWERVR